MGLFTDFLKLFMTNMETDGDDTFDFERDINEPFRKIDSAIKELQEKSDFTPFCFNSGPVDDKGEPALLELKTVIEELPAENEDEESGTIEKRFIILKSPAVYTDGNGKTTVISEDLILDVTDFKPGAEYSLRVAENNGTVDFFAVKGAKVYKQKNPPENSAQADVNSTTLKPGDLWQNQSVAPELAYIRTDDNTWQLTNQVEAGTYTAPDISGGGGVIKCNPYNTEKLTENVREIEANALTRNDKAEIASWGMPDYSAGIITESGFIADEDYLVYAIPAQRSNVWCVITNADNLALYQCWMPNGYQQQIGGWFKLPKGEKLLVASGSFTAVTRFPLIGGKND